MGRLAGGSVEVGWRYIYTCVCVRACVRACVRPYIYTAGDVVVR